VESAERMILTQIDPMHLENTPEERQEEIQEEWITKRKQKPETTRLTKAQCQRKQTMTQESKLNDDPFIGKPVAFSTNRDIV
jgi:hypothetical protein